MKKVINVVTTAGDFAEVEAETLLSVANGYRLSQPLSSDARLTDLEKGKASGSATNLSVRDLRTEIAHLTEEREWLRKALQAEKIVSHEHWGYYQQAESSLAAMRQQHQSVRIGAFDYVANTDGTVTRTDWRKLKEERNALAYDKTCLHEDVAQLRGQLAALTEVHERLRMAIKTALPLVLRAANVGAGARSAEGAANDAIDLATQAEGILSRAIKGTE